MDAVRTDLSWQDVERLTGALATHLGAASGVETFDRVVGVARGGLIPAALLATRLRIDRIETVQMRFYDGSRPRPAPERIGGPALPAGPSGDPKRTLVVDEIVDSGATVRALHAMLPEATFAALVARNAPPAARTHADLSAYAVEDSDAQVWTAGALQADAWILFPWSPLEDREGPA